MTTTRAWLFIDRRARAPGLPRTQTPAGRSASTPHPFARRVKERAQRNPRRNALRCDLHLVVARPDPLRAHRGAAVDQIAEPQGSAEGVAEHPRGDLADEFAVSPDRLIVIEQAIRPLESHRDQPATHPSLALPRERLETHEAAGLVPGEGEVQARLERRVFIAQVVSPVPVSLLHTQAVQRMVAGEAQAKRGACAYDEVEHRLRELCGNVQLVAELPHVRDATRPDTRVAQIDDLGRGERPRGGG